MSLTINQQDYANSLESIPLNNEQLSCSHKNLNKQETSKLRCAIGQLNWLANITRLEISYQVSNIGSEIKEATTKTIKEVNKIIKFVKENKSYITFPSFHLPCKKVTMYSDASFNNVSNYYSHGGYIACLTDQHNNSCTISWKSIKLQQVAR